MEGMFGKIFYLVLTILALIFMVRSWKARDTFWTVTFIIGFLFSVFSLLGFL